MSLEQLKSEADALSAEERRELISYLIQRGRKHSAAYWDKLAAIVPRSYDDMQDQQAVQRYSDERIAAAVTGEDHVAQRERSLPLFGGHQTRRRTVPALAQALIIHRRHGEGLEEIQRRRGFSQRRQSRFQNLPAILRQGRQFVADIHLPAA